MGLEKCKQAAGLHDVLGDTELRNGPASALPFFLTICDVTIPDRLVSQITVTSLFYLFYYLINCFVYILIHR